jgi:hypothetical protein
MPAWRVFKLANPFSYAWRGMIKGEKYAWTNYPGALHAAERGVQLGVTQDIPINQVQSTLNALAEKFSWLPGAKLFINTFAKLTDRWNIALWDYLHDGQVSILDPKDPRLGDMVKAEREIAQLVNDTFGGQFYDILGTRELEAGRILPKDYNKILYNPKTMAILDNLMLATDWNISTLRQFGAPFGYGSMYKETAWLRKKIGRKFWLRVISILGLGYESLNVINRKRDEKQNPKFYIDQHGKPYKLKPWEYTMLGNTLGKRSNIFLKRDDQGREVYIRAGKQFREAWELFENRYGWGFPGPLIDKSGSKLNPNIQLLSMLYTHHSASGFPNYDLIDAKANWDVAKGVLLTIAKAPFPFSGKAMFNARKEWTPLNLFLPTSSGMSSRFAQELFEMELMGATDKKELDMGSMLEIYIGAVRNNLDAKGIMDRAINNVEARAIEDRRLTWRTIEDLQKHLDAELAKVDPDPKLMEAIAKDLKAALKHDAIQEHQMKYWPGMAAKANEVLQNWK